MMLVMANGECLLEANLPIHVTALWLPVWRRSPLDTGSLGAGLLLEPGVKIRVSSCGPGRRCGLRLRLPEGWLDGLPSVVAEVYRLAPSASRLSVTLESPVPLGVGYAVSAAAALAASLALVAQEGATVEEAARIAHMAEVAAGTGLGDVVAMLYGRGLEMRLAPGAPGLARVESIPVSGEVVTVSLGSAMETGEMHRGLSWRLHSLAAPRLARLFSRPSLESLLEEARGFSLEAGFVSRSQVELFDALVEEGLARGWYAKKRVAVLVAEPRRAEELAERLRGEGFEPRLHRVSTSPLRVTMGCS